MFGLECHQLFTMGGLSLDIIGVIILAWFALPKIIARSIVSDRDFFIEGVEPTPAQIERDRRVAAQERRNEVIAAIGHWFGVAALVVGFFLQGIGAAIA